MYGCVNKLNNEYDMCIQCSIYYLNSMVYFEQDIIDKSSRLLKNSNENIFLYCIVNCQMQCTYFPDSH